MSEGSTNLNGSKGKQEKGEDCLRLKKLAKNRESATRCRNKRKAEINSMESDLQQIAQESNELTSQSAKYEQFLERLKASSEFMTNKAKLLAEENNQLKIQFMILQTKYVQMQQVVLTMCNQNSNIEMNGIKLQ